MSYRYFAFLDLLGYRDLIKNDLNNGTEDLRTKLLSAFNSISDINESDVSIKAISDSIFLTLNNETLGFSYFANVLKKLQISFIKNGLLLRGGVAYNKHFENGKVTYSPALVEAYQVESQTAFFPRIVIHSAVIEKLKNEGLLSSIIKDRILVQHRNTFQIHFIDDTNWTDLKEQLSIISSNAESAINQDPKIFAKYWYLQDYFSTYKPKGARFSKYLETWKI
jgi:hypothetical protein